MRQLNPCNSYDSPIGMLKMPSLTTEEMEAMTKEFNNMMGINYVLFPAEATVNIIRYPADERHPFSKKRKLRSR